MKQSRHCLIIVDMQYTFKKSIAKFNLLNFAILFLKVYFVKYTA